MEQVDEIISPEERERYQRQLLMADWSESFQLKLKNLHVAVMGIGGAASSVINNLLLLGVGTIEAIDHDVVELSNLNRQFVHNVEHIGMGKAESLKIYARRLNPHVKIIAKKINIDETTIQGAIDPGTDIIIDTFDKWASRFIVNQFAVKNRIPYLLAGVVSNCFYTALLSPPRTPCLQCLLGRFQKVEMLSSLESTVFTINILPIAALGAFSIAEIVKYLRREEISNDFYFGSLYPTRQDIRFFTLFLSKHFKKISEEQGVHWEKVWDSEGIIKLKLSKDPECRVCGKLA